MTLLEQLLADDTLFEGWERVRKNQGMAGSDGQTIEHFGRNLFSRLLDLKEHVRRKSYQPQPLLEFHITKPSGGQRRLAVPAVRDRVLQSAACIILTPILEREFQEQSFAYRVGRSVPMAVARVAWYRDQGYQWVVDADIQSFFDNIDHKLLIGMLRANLGGDHSLLPLIELWLAAVANPGRGQPYLLTKGVPQGGLCKALHKPPYA
ncbi:MAG: hypothetical protein KJ558_13480 [Gammaproteobacteria bacterium]|nr:hypothetical protein [Gammaproteobacteria bacterium]MBU1655806.1 hypothetical protein [Gammaproteobacteria bacterium]MBU1960197.1 hypothetical protein [Gammaproteobacteria bacterium]